MTITRALFRTLLAGCVFVGVAQAEPMLKQFESEISRLVERNAPQIVTVQAQFPSLLTETGGSGVLNVGSGLILDSLGYVVTSVAVISHGSSFAEMIGVVGNSGEMHEAMLFGVDPTLRIAFLYVPTLPVSPAVNLRRERWTSGSFAVIVGNSSGVSPAVALSIVAGRRDIDGFWQLSGPAAPGMSGAPVYDSDGRLGGLLVGEVATYGAVSNRPLPAVMVSSERLRESINKHVIRSSERGRPWLGITVRPRMESDGSVHVFVSDVVSNSPAQQAGILAGDVLLSVEGTSIGYVSDLADWIRSSQPGREATLHVQRGDQQRAVTVTVGRR